MPKKLVAKTGNEAFAEAMRQINPDVCAAYPITPATEIMQIFASFVADGLVDTELVTVESEHSAMSACIGAAASGARTITATSSQGLALMYEMMYIAAGLRLPIVMANVNRALSAPINIHCDHSDTMGARDSGWIQIFSENSQEAYDNMIQAVRIAENVCLPVLVTTDGFIISHALEGVEILEDSEVKELVGGYHPPYNVLDVDHPITVGAIDFTDYYFEHKRAEIEAMRKAKQPILDMGKEFGVRFGRYYSLFESFYLDDAEVAIVVMGSTAGTAKVVIRELREKGVKAGMLKLRVFRPFPAEELASILSPMKVIAVLDRSDGLSGLGGPLFGETKSALFNLSARPRLVNYVYGLGGRDISLNQLRSVYSDLLEIMRTGKITHLVNYLGVRE